MVIVGHTGVIGPLTKIIYSFHMPLFAMITGFLYNTENETMTISAYINKIFTKYVRPLVVFLLLNICMEIVIISLLGQKIEQKLILIWLLGAFTGIDRYGWMTDWPQLWYLSAISVSSIIFWMVRKYFEKPASYVFFFLIPSMGYMCYLFNLPKIVWNIDSASMLFIFLGLGFYIKNDFCQLVFQLKKHQILVVVIFLAGIMMAYKNPTPAGMVGFDYNTYGDFVMMIMPAIVLSVVTMSLSFLVYDSKINNFCIIGSLCSFVNWLGKHTLVIFGFDLMINRIARHIVFEADFNRFFVIIVKLSMDIILVIGWNYVKVMHKKIKHIERRKYM